MSGNEHPDVAFVLEAFHAFDLREGSLEDYFERFYAPDGVLEFVDGFPIPGRYEGAEGFKAWFADSYEPYDNVKREAAPRARISTSKSSSATRTK